MARWQQLTSPIAIPTVFASGLAKSANLRTSPRLILSFLAASASADSPSITSTGAFLGSAAAGAPAEPEPPALAAAVLGRGVASVDA